MGGRTANPEQPGRHPSLSRSLGRTAMTLVTASLINNTGICAALGSAMSQAGSGILLAITLGDLVVRATGLSAASLGVTFEKGGGACTWARAFGDKTIALGAGCA